MALHVVGVVSTTLEAVARVRGYLRPERHP